MEPVPVREAIADLRRGRMLILLDHGQRSSEGYLMMAADRVTPEAINLMASFGRGLVRLALPPRRVVELDLPLMLSYPANARAPLYTISIDARHGTTTGTSAYDRALTILKAVSHEARPEDFLRPGHVFPVQAREGGVLEFPGPAEVAVDLARLAGLYPAGVYCEILRDDGAVARHSDLWVYARDYALSICVINDVVEAVRNESANSVACLSRAPMTTRWGVFDAAAYRHNLGGQTHLVLTMGETDGSHPPLVRIQFECVTGGVFGSRHCDCADQVAAAMQQIAAAGSGVLVYVRQGSRGIGVEGELQALVRDGVEATGEGAEQEGGMADARDSGLAARILRHLGIQRVRLMTNNHHKAEGLQWHGIRVVEQIPLVTQDMGITQK